MSEDVKLFDNKLIILFALVNAHMHLSIDQITKYLEDFEDITYIDICSYIESLKSNEYIKESYSDDTVLYFPTEDGKNTLNELQELVPGVNLYTLKKLLDKNKVKVKTDYSINTNIYPLKDDEFKVSCDIKDGADELVNITLYATSKSQAKNIAKNWEENAENIYTNLLQDMTKH